MRHARPPPMFTGMVLSSSDNRDRLLPVLLPRREIGVTASEKSATPAGHDSI